MAENEAATITMSGQIEDQELYKIGYNVAIEEVLEDIEAEKQKNWVADTRYGIGGFNALVSARAKIRAKQKAE